MQHIFDRHRIKQNKDRAALSFPQHDFLHRHTAKNLRDRLRDIRKETPSVLDLGSSLSALDNAVIQEKNITSIVHTHTSRTMLEKHAANNLAQTQELDDESFAVVQEPYDMIISNVSLHMVNNLPQVLHHILQSLKPDGFFLASLIGGETLQEIKPLMMDVENDLYGGVAARIAPMIDIKTMGSLMQQCGFALPVVDDEKITVSYKSVENLFHDLRGMGESRPFPCQAPYNLSRRYFDALNDRIIRNKEGRFDVTFHILYIIGWRPHESQPKPLKRGSATHSLKQVLKKPS